MDTETKEKLTEQQHQIEMLRTETEANMRTMKAESESAIDRLQLSNEKAIGGLRSDHEKAIGELRSTIFVHMIGVATLVVAAVGVLIAYLQFFA